MAKNKKKSNKLILALKIVFSVLLMGFFYIYPPTYLYFFSRFDLPQFFAPKETDNDKVRANTYNIDIIKADLQNTEVRLKKIEASSIMPDPYGLNRYVPESAFDGDKASAWLESLPGAGINESLKISFDTPLAVDRISVQPGYFDQQWFLNNHRVKAALIEMQVVYNKKGGKAIAPVAELLRFTVNFMDSMNSQDVYNNQILLSSFKITILETYPSKLDDDTAISEITFYWNGREYTLTSGYD